MPYILKTIIFFNISLEYYILIYVLSNEFPKLNNLS